MGDTRYRFTTRVCENSTCIWYLSDFITLEGLVHSILQEVSESPDNPARVFLEGPLLARYLTVDVVNEETVVELTKSISDFLHKNFKGGLRRARR